ncbi:hypothetical protein D9615_008335 [Tricholomella constricta]|uniref:HMG box domain-containing protein n=1 Tax=Tricholomella constricta TaxID=117010 RepID=A0A8H5M561_9AGAR|nr:hypothetical protein D9615_008335 [Tricholomella constricta]
MPAFRNVKSRRSSGRIWNKVPIVYDEQGWETLPAPINYSRSQISSPHSTATSPSTSSADSDFESRPVRKNKGKGKASDPDHVPRPKNAFIFFRSYFYQTLGGNDQNQISVAAGKAWKALPDEEKLPFQVMAEKEKREHQARFPHYTYAPGIKGCNTKRKPSGKKRTQPSAKKVLVSQPKRASLRASQTHIRLSRRTPSPPPQIAIPTLPQSSPVVPEASQPVIDVTNDELQASESPFTPGWSFVPTSEIPPLELSLAKSEKDSLIDLSLRPSGYDYIDQQFLPYSAAVPATVESFFAGSPQEELYYDYVDLPNYDYHLSQYSPLEESSSGLQWMDATALSQDVPEPSYFDYTPGNGTTDSYSYGLFEPVVSQEAYLQKRYSAHAFSPNVSELEMDQFINYCN